MSNKLYEEQYIQNIAEAIREKTGKTDTMLVSQMAEEISGISGSGSSVGAELNIHYGDTEPDDTSKLWCKCGAPSKVLISSALATGEEKLTTLTTVLPFGCTSMGCASVGAKIYLFGGYGNGANLSTIRVFDTKTKELMECESVLPSTRNEVGTSAVGTKIYLFGGYGTASLSEILLFDTETETIATLSAKLPTASYGLVCATVGTKIYIFYSNGTICVFNTETETIATLSATVTTPGNGMACVAVGTKIYLFGGYASSGMKNIVRVFDTETNTCSVLSTTLPDPCRYMGCGIIGEKIYLFGGYCEGGSKPRLDTINVFDTESESVTTLPITIPTECYSMASAVVGMSIYLFGGTTYQSNAWVYLDTINEFSVTFELETSKLLIQTSQTENIFNVVNGEQTIEIGVRNIYIGNSDGYGETVDSYLYQNEEWSQI